MSQADIVFASTVPDGRSTPQFLKIFSYFFPFKENKTVWFAFIVPHSWGRENSC